MVTITVAKYCYIHQINILDLFTVTSESFTPNPIVACLNNLLDIKEWLAPCLNDVHGHTQTHCFKFMLKDSKAVMYYKTGVVVNGEKDLVFVRYQRNLHL